MTEKKAEKCAHPGCNCPARRATNIVERIPKASASRPSSACREIEIKKAVRASDVVIVCLSTSVTKGGVLQKEIKFALDVADEQLPGTIFIIPLKLEECDVPDRLGRWHWVALYEPTGYERLFAALERRAQTLKLTFSHTPDRTRQESPVRVPLEKPVATESETAEKAEQQQLRLTKDENTVLARGSKLE